MRGYRGFSSSPRPGRLDHRITVGYTENIVNENGFPETRDVELCNVWAALEDAGNEYYRAADAVNTEQVINFTIRHRDDIKPGMWVKWSGDESKWIIRMLNYYSFKKQYLGLKADRQLGVSG